MLAAVIAAKHSHLLVSSEQGKGLGVPPPYRYRAVFACAGGDPVSSREMCQHPAPVVEAVHAPCCAATVTPYDVDEVVLPPEEKHWSDEVLPAGELVPAWHFVHDDPEDP
eukprot:588472-Rhodomonas_salina.1